MASVTEVNFADIELSRLDGGEVVYLAVRTAEISDDGWRSKRVITIPLMPNEVAELIAALQNVPSNDSVKVAIP